jgi:phosphatidylethanolamine/phosphatidyl-N-methylethanolamine N-methyltransferase
MQQQWADYRVFLREFRRTFESTGAVMPSGARLSRALAHFVREGPSPCPLPEGEGIGRRILEVGPGTGAVTAHIVRALRSGDRLDLVERNEEFVARLRARLQSDPSLAPHAERITLHHAGVEELSEAEPYDVIVSGLPLNNFPLSLVEMLVDKLRRLLAPGGTLSFFEYIAIRRVKAAVSSRVERERLRAIGKLLDRFLADYEIRRDKVFVNVPPAWVHHVRVEAGSREQRAGSKTSGSMLHAPGSLLQ